MHLSHETPPDNCCKTMITFLKRLNENEWKIMKSILESNAEWKLFNNIFI